MNVIEILKNTFKTVTCYLVNMKHGAFLQDNNGNVGLLETVKGRYIMIDIPVIIVQRNSSY